ncbi:hypothetical protein [Vibrio vulnificus]|uniref:hypothetical protein n=1 Tax=Vibrio vulnificus TaxID=672 RepID=UPI000C7CF027|nr:hypothetical protein [Vibrio vulnificus]EHH0849927.1 hypothetical protein [Vibrio vulnificus]
MKKSIFLGLFLFASSVNAETTEQIIKNNLPKEWIIEAYFGAICSELASLKENKEQSCLFNTLVSQQAQRAFTTKNSEIKQQILGSLETGYKVFGESDDFDFQKFTSTCDGYFNDNLYTVLNSCP